MNTRNMSTCLWHLSLYPERHTAHRTSLAHKTNDLMVRCINHRLPVNVGYLISNLQSTVKVCSSTCHNRTNGRLNK